MISTLPEALHLIAAQQEQLQVQRDQLATLTDQVATLEQALHSAQQTIIAQQHQLNQYLDRLYGRRSERFDPNQLCLELIVLQADALARQQTDAGEPLPAAVANEDGDAVPPRPPRKPRQGNGRLPLPAHLERHIIELEVPAAQRLCPLTGAVMEPIGYDDTEQLEYHPGHLSVTVYRRWKYASPDRRAGYVAGIVTAPLPDHPIAKCKAAPGLIAHAVVSKYADHLPWYRQDEIFAREGVRLPRSTLDDWALNTAEAIAPLGQVLKQTVLDTEVLFTDDSPLPLLEKGRGRTHTAYLWVYIRGGPGPALVAFDFTYDRRKQRPLEYLDDYSGYIHADAYSGYDELFRREGIIEVGCWAHARRGFDQALRSRPREASQILVLIGQLYTAERCLRGLPADQRREGRQATVAPIVDRIFAHIEPMYAATTPSEPLHKACVYALNQRQPLHTFLEDGRLEPDNNTAENAIRPLAIGRKNWLFAGSERGGQATALYLSLIQSCKACQVNPWAYFNDILRRIMSHPVRRLRELLPDQWKPLRRDRYGAILID